MDILNSAITYGLAGLIAGLFSVILKKMDMMDKKRESAKTDNAKALDDNFKRIDKRIDRLDGYIQVSREAHRQNMLRQLESYYGLFKEQGYKTPEQWIAFQDIYTTYKKLDGNHHGDSIHAEAELMPLKQEVKE